GEAYGEGDLRLVSVVAGQLAAYLTALHLYTQAQLGLRLRDAVLAMVSHDLKNPLAAIRGYAQLLERLLGRLDETVVPDRERLVRSASGITAGSTKMARQIEELLDAARLGAGEALELRRRPVDLVALVGQVLAQEAQASGRHRLRLEPAVPSLVGEWDPERLERVVANLVSNAVKYSAEGTEVRVWVEAEGGEAVVSVRDEGIGIPAGDVEHVFGPFRRAGNVSGRIRGSGLGLTSARAIVEQHGGSIDVRSEEGKGSTFRVRLPTAAPNGGEEGNARPA
ncbi:MAG TPA: HAMP domain-containing sensor histidine kinase, partial [Chloroflexota bacterium]|nr:HAMP domain-containing sensor histidine kinase [Chloroflexota bacterium]